MTVVAAKQMKASDIFPANTFPWLTWAPACVILACTAAAQGSALLGVAALVAGVATYRRFHLGRVARFASALVQVQKIALLGGAAQTEEALDLFERRRPPGYLRSWAMLERALLAFGQTRLDDAERFARALLALPTQRLGRGSDALARAYAKAGTAVVRALAGDVEGARALGDDALGMLANGSCDVALGVGHVGGATVVSAYVDLARALVLLAKKADGELAMLLAARGESMRRSLAEPYREIVRAVELAAREATGLTPYRTQRPADRRGEPNDTSAPGFVARVAPHLPLVPLFGDARGEARLRRHP